MPPASSLQPPRLAASLIDLVSPYEQAESISGDLLEEFSEVASKSGVASARRWYWRQSLKTIAHLIVAEGRAAPWPIAGAVCGGLLLLTLIPYWTLHTGVVVLLKYSHVHCLGLSLNSTALIVYTAETMLIGCIVAFAAKGREIVASTVLFLAYIALIGVFWVWLAMHRPHVLLLWPPLWIIIFECSFIILGGVIVRARDVLRSLFSNDAVG